MNMKIENNDILIKEIKGLLHLVESEAHKNTPTASAYQDIHQKLLKIQEFIIKNDFSLPAKQSCDMGGDFAYLYEQNKELPSFFKSLCTINTYYQNAKIPILNSEDAGAFFLRLSRN